MLSLPVGAGTSAVKTGFNLIESLREMLSDPDLNSTEVQRQLFIDAVRVYSVPMIKIGAIG